MTAQFVSPRVPLVDARGMVTREWYLLFQSIFRMGGGVDNDMAQLLAPVSPSTDAIDALARAQADADVAPPPMPPSLFYAADDVLPLIGALRDEIAMLRALVDDLQKGPTL